MRLSTVILLLLAAAIPAAAQIRPDTRGVADRHPELVGPQPTETTTRGTAGGGVFTDISTSPVGPSVDGEVMAVVPGPDGSFVVGGHFTEAGGRSAANVARWTGTAWEPLGSGLTTSTIYDAYVHALVTGPDGTLYAGGTFTSAGGASVSGVARWDGSLWHSLSGAVPDTLARRISALAVGPDGRVYAAGTFTGTAGEYVTGVARWTGATWEVLGGPVGLAREPYAVAVGSDGVVYAAGYPLLDGSAVVVRWDGVRWMSIGTVTAGGRVSSLTLAPDGSLVAGGYFSSIGGVAAAGVARWNGSFWSPLGSGFTGTYGQALINVVQSGPDGTLYAGGSFVSSGGQPLQGLARWTGTAWTSVGGGTDWFANTIAFDSEGRLLTGGAFSVAGSTAADGVARWDGASWQGFGSETSYAEVASTGPHGSVYALGVSTVAGVSVNGLARWDGTRWSALGGGPGAGRAVAEDVDGRVIATRGTNGRVMVWDGASWTALGGTQPVGLNDFYSAEIWTDGAVYVGGREDNGQRGIVRWDGTAWTDVGAGLQGDVWCMATGPDGRLYVGGARIHRPGDTEDAAVARWDGTAWEIIGTTSTGSEETVYALTFAQNGDLYAGGAFGTLGGTEAHRLARWDGSTWSDAGTPEGVPDVVMSLAVARDGRLYAGGDPHGFTPGFSRWDGTSWTALGPLTGFGIVYGIGLDRNGDIILGGIFRGAGDVVSPNVMRYTPGTVASEPVAGGDRLRLAVTPNPARGSATVTLSHPAGAVTVEVLDALGRRVALVADGDMPAGTRTLPLPLGRLAPGVYAVRLTAGREALTQALVVVR